MRKKVLIYPCGTEIAFEIYNSVKYSTFFEVYGGSSDYDHGHFVYDKLVEKLPFITDNSSREEVSKFNESVKSYGFDFIYPAMDGVLTVFARHREELDAVLVAPDAFTSEAARRKSRTYELLKGIIPLPRLYKEDEIPEKYPVFTKPDIAQGSKGARRIDTREIYISLRNSEEISDNLVLEYLPGKEYTIDCFTNLEGRLVYARGRGRNRIKTGISVNTELVSETENKIFWELAEKINSVLHQRGGWFFQLREAENGELKLLEVSARIAGTSAITRNIGVNLPLLTLFTFSGQNIEDIIINDYRIELDRAFANSYRISLEYDRVYIDFDDTLIWNGKVNLRLISFMYQCLNEGKKLILITRHDGDLEEELIKYRLTNLFDEIIHLNKTEQKSDFIDKTGAILIDDSYGERKEVYEKLGIPVFDVPMTECLMKSDD